MPPPPAIFSPARHPWCSLCLLVTLALPLTAPAQDRGYPGDSFPDLSRGMSRMSERAPIFFPPNPPPLGRALPRGAPPSGRLAAPPELAAHVNEPYYPQLGTRLATNKLPEKLKARVEQYRTEKLARQKELRAELERVSSLDAAARETALAALARRQAPALATLEATAEQLRRDLIVSDQAWSALRQWRLSDREERGFSPLEIAEVMRAYAYYQNYLLPAQRRLLREIALELQTAGSSTDRATENQPYLFFPPEPARVLLPDDLPAEVAAQLARYQTLKSTLKKELYDTVHAHDGRGFNFFRGNTLKALAEQQAPRLAEMEKLAEEIRRGLAIMAEPADIAERTPLPPVLQQRVATLLQEVGQAQREASEQVDAILADARELPMQATYRFEVEGLKFIVIPSRAGRGSRNLNPETQAQVAAVREKVAAVAESYGRRLAEFINERDAIRAEIGPTLHVTGADRINTALNTAMRVATARETESVYREYRLALFQPGLSPEQRRLLFDSVIERLELPLPRGELQPVMRSPTW